MKEVRYPIGIQTFEKLRDGNFVYVDKTRYIQKIVSGSGYYFLSRPRRFGKSLLLSTIEAFFKGKRNLFAGLDIENYEHDWQEHPVIHIDLNSKNYVVEQSLIDIISFNLAHYEQQYGIDGDAKPVDDRFMNLIRTASIQTGRKVVVLIDEYDKPLLQTIDNPDLQDRYCGILKSFYGVLKSADQFLRFVFLTGVTRFGKVSVFSDLNNLRDISMDNEFDAICGITENELHDNFGPGIKKLAEVSGISVDDAFSSLKTNYDGYHFSDNLTDIYNPFSVLSALAASAISNYWFSTGTPSFLIKLLQSNNYDLSSLKDGVEYDPMMLMGSVVTPNDAVPMMYQSGYLTIKRIDPLFATAFLGYPNREVEDCFLKWLLPSYGCISGAQSTSFINNFVRNAMSGNVDAFMSSLQSLLAGVPVHNNDPAMLELHYRNMMYLIASLVGFTVHTEYQTSCGRIDMVIETPDYVYVMEFKLHGSAEDAMSQIEDKHYTLPFNADGRKVIKIAAAFSNKTRTITRWLVK